jgi:hypothetical protein
MLNTDGNFDEESVSASQFTREDEDGIGADEEQMNDLRGVMGDVEEGEGEYAEDLSDGEDKSTIMGDNERSKAGTPTSGIDHMALPGDLRALAMAETSSSKRGGLKGARAKAVDCFSLDGKLLNTYPSGLIASKALGISQGDVSLCCRGLKDSVSIYKFKFHGDATDYSAAKMKRGYQLVEEDLNPDAPLSALGERRLKRLLRNQAEQIGNESNSLLRNSHHKARQWDMQTVNLGPFSVKQWVPRTTELNQALQEQKKMLANQSKKQKGTKSSKKK